MARDNFELLKESYSELHKLQKKKTLLSLIQTATNHIPFTVTEQKESYTPLKDYLRSSFELKKTGYNGINRLNDITYALVFKDS